MKRVLLYPARLVNGDSTMLYVHDNYAHDNNTVYDVVVSHNRNLRGGASKYRSVPQVKVGLSPVMNDTSVVYAGQETQYGMDIVRLPKGFNQYVLMTRNGPLSWDPEINTECKVVQTLEEILK
jgi:hypothetical protein